MSTTIKKPARRRGLVLAVVGFFVAVGVVGSLIGVLGGDPAQTTFTSEESTHYSEGQRYSGPPIQRFTPAEAQQLAQGLAAAEAAHGVCFGWKLVDASTKQFDQGSSRGPNIPAETCPRWAEVRVFVAAGSTEDDPDAADVKVAASDDLASLPGVDDFVNLGVTADSLGEEPVTVAGQAALGLPLLLVETGALKAPPVADDASGNASAPPLPRGDGSGSNWLAWAWLGGLGVVVVLALLLGFRARAKQKSTSDTPDAPNAPAAPQPRPTQQQGAQFPPPTGPRPPQGPPALQGPPAQPGPPRPGPQPPQGPPVGPGSPPVGPQQPPRPPQGPPALQGPPAQPGRPRPGPQPGWPPPPPQGPPPAGLRR
ncbi:hypothetical protein [Saccharopolyspora pogona]|uniref:hypothetical protein n=1 Tax=Saccharopolyspora pogona TaxID=333966 RepID=UPI00168203BA|nr:hypothetical protein [Saccharopolyspora pogona]